MQYSTELKRIISFVSRSVVLHSEHSVDSFLLQFSTCYQLYKMYLLRQPRCKSEIASFFGLTNLNVFTQICVYRAKP